MKNYYDELEVSKTASKEVIEKVYKILAKKYHPDTTKETDKQAAEEKFKSISEAYEILSDDEKRNKYDLELTQSYPTISYMDYMNIVRERDELSNALHELKGEAYNFKNSYNNYNEDNQSNSYNTYQDIEESTNENYSDLNTNLQQKDYYYKETEPSFSPFDYFKYQIREFFSNIFSFILYIIIFIVLFNIFF